MAITTAKSCRPFARPVALAKFDQRAISIDPDDIETQYIVACVYAQIGDVEAAIGLLEKAARQTSSMEPLTWMKNDPDLDPVRSHPRYQMLTASLDKT